MRDEFKDAKVRRKNVENKMKLNTMNFNKLIYYRLSY